MRKKSLMCLPLLLAMTLTSCGVDKATFVQKVDEKKETAKYSDYTTMVFNGSYSGKSGSSSASTKYEKSTYSVTWLKSVPTFVAKDDNGKTNYDTVYSLVLTGTYVLSSSLVSGIDEEAESISYSAGSNFAITYSEKEDDNTTKSTITWNGDLLLTKITLKTTGTDTNVSGTLNFSWSK